MSIYDVNGNIIPTGDSTNSKTKYPWLNIAHKGTAPNEYGNSIYSFNRSHNMGFDGVECDVRMTADNVVVMSHDATITGTDGSGTQQTLRIIDSNYEDLAALTLFTVDGIDYHLLSFEQFIRMAFNWNWIVELDFKSQGNTQDCVVKCSEIVRDNGMCGKVVYLSTWGKIENILQNDPTAMFNVPYDTDIPTSDYADVPIERLWMGIQRNSIPQDISTINRNRPMCIWDVGEAQANMVIECRPNAIQWTGDTDGVNLSEIYMASLDWN